MACHCLLIDAVAEDPAKAVEEKLEIDAATKKALEKEEASEKKDGAGSDEAAKISIVKTAAEVKPHASGI